MDITVDFKELRQGRLVIHYVDGDFSKVHQYKVPLDFFIRADSLVALAIACRPKPMEMVKFNFPVSTAAVSMLFRDYRISVTSEASEENKTLGREPFLGVLPKRNRRFLSFSGGVDSLAARYLIGGDAEILSIDYGPRFAREREFFDKWQTLVIETNFRDKPFSENLDWRFMSSGALLMSDYLGIDTVLFGTILEASPFWFNVIDRSCFENLKHYQSFAIANIRSGQTVTCLSEYGTTKIASLYGGSILEESISSAADEKTSKKLRKLLLGKIALGEDITDCWAENNRANDNPESDKSFASDILGLYFSWKLGVEFTDKYVIKMSDKYREFASFADMRFFERFNQFNLNSAPEDLRNKFVKIFHEAGLEQYDDRDIASLKAVREFLSSTYRFAA